MKKSLLLFVLLWASAAVSQQGYIHGYGPPTAAVNCGASRFYIDDTTGQMYQSAQGAPCAWATGSFPGVTSDGANGINVAGSVAVTQLNSVKYANRYATAGAGTSVNPWAGWENALVGGAKVIFPCGYYSTTQQFNLTGSFTLEGASRDCTVIRYTGASGAFLGVNNATSGAALTQGWAIRDLTIANTGSGSYGIQFGHTSGSPLTANNGLLENVNVTGFATAGYHFIAGEIMTLLRVNAESNTGDGMKFETVSGANLNTTINCFGCRAYNNAGVGVNILAGIGISFYGLDSEYNGLEGVKIVGASAPAVARVRTTGSWIEGNNSSRTNGPYYQFSADTSDSSTMQGLFVEQTTFAVGGTGNKHIYLGRVAGSATASGGQCRFYSNNYQNPNTSYGATAASSAISCLVEGEALANWSVGAGAGMVFESWSGNTLTFENASLSTPQGSSGVAGMVIKGVCTGTATSSATQSFYGLGTMSAACGAAPNTSYDAYVPVPGTLSNLYVHLGTTTIVSGSLTFTVYKNNVATALVCTVTNPGVSCTDSSHTVSMNAGDYVDVRFTSNASETAANIAASLIFK